MRLISDIQERAAELSKDTNRRQELYELLDSLDIVYVDTSWTDGPLSEIPGLKMVGDLLRWVDEQDQPPASGEEKDTYERAVRLVYAMGVKDEAFTEIANRTAEATSIFDIGLTVRSENCLARSGIYKVGDLLKVLRETPDQFCKIRNLGVKSQVEILDRLLEFGYGPFEIR